MGKDARDAGDAREDGTRGWTRVRAEGCAGREEARKDARDAEDAPEERAGRVDARNAWGRAGRGGCTGRVDARHGREDAREEARNAGRTRGTRGTRGTHFLGCHAAYSAPLLSLLALGRFDL